MAEAQTVTDTADTAPGAIGRRIKQRVDILGISAAELARRVGISQPTIHALINGASQRSRYLTQIAAALGCDPVWLETGTGPVTPAGSDILNRTLMRRVISAVLPALLPALHNRTLSATQAADALIAAHDDWTVWDPTQPAPDTAAPPAPAAPPPATPANDS